MVEGMARHAPCRAGGEDRPVAAVGLGDHEFARAAVHVAAAGDDSPGLGHREVVLLAIGRVLAAGARDVEDRIRAAVALVHPVRLDGRER